MLLARTGSEHSQHRYNQNHPTVKNPALDGFKRCGFDSSQHELKYFLEFDLTLKKNHI